jgi:hypothetical protein
MPSVGVSRRSWWERRVASGIGFLKEAKNFCVFARVFHLARAQTCKSFLVLFFKKEHAFFF